MIPQEVLVVINLVETTFNGGPRSYALGKKTLVVGSTGSGKTTLIASLGLLLVGAADDTIGRDKVAASQDLALAMAEDQTDIEVKAFRANGTESVQLGRYSLRRGKQAAVYTEANWPQSDWRHPVRELRRILRQRSDEARSDLAPLLLGDDPIEVHRLVAVQVADTLPRVMRTAEIVRAVAEAEEDHGRTDKKRKDLLASIENIERMLPSRPNPEALAAAKAAAEAALVAHGAAAEVSGRRKALTEQATFALREHEQLLNRAAQLTHEFQEAQSAATATAEQPPIEGVLPENQRENVRAYLRVLPLSKEGRCPLCQTPQAPLESLSLHLKGLLERDEAARQLQAQRESAALMAARLPPRRSLEVIRAEYTQIAQSAAQAGERHRSLTEAINALPVVDTGTSDPREAQAMLTALETAEGSWVRATSLRAELLQVQQQVADKKLRAEELRRLLDSVYTQRTAAAEEGISKWLPKGYRVVLALVAPNGSNIFKLALQLPDGRVIGNPSGGQRSAMLLALAVYLIEKRRIPIEGPQVVMLPEERGFSPGWLGKVMTALAEAPCQVVLTALQKPTGFRGKGWDILELPGEEAPRGRPKKSAGGNATAQDDEATETEQLPLSPRDELDELFEGP